MGISQSPITNPQSLTLMPGAPQPAQKKQDEVKILQEKLESAKSAVIVDYSTLSVKEKTQLLDTVKAAGGQFLVAKNSLMHIAFGKRDELKDSFKGMNAVLFSYEDAVAPLKALMEFNKQVDKLEVKQGLMDGEVLSVQAVKTLSNLPSREQLIATLISRLHSPAYGLVNVLQASGRNLVYALSAISKKEKVSA